MDDRTAMLPVVPAVDPLASNRRFADLRWLRVFVALAAAPLLGAVALAYAVDFVDGFFAEEENGMRWDGFTILVASPSLWALVSGLAYLQIVTRVRGRIARYECLLLGAGSAFLAPFVLFVCADLFRARLPEINWWEIQLVAFIGLFALPFGLLGGWVFWRLGVRPATAPTRDFAAVFD